jgi:uncharacterized protein (TIGR02246 family)
MANGLTRRGLIGAFLAAAAELIRPESAAAQRGPARQAIEDANRRFVEALRAGDASGCAAVYSPTARLMPPNSPMQTGKSAIEAFWDGVVKSGVKGGTRTTLDLDELRGTAVEIGTYALETEPPGKPARKDQGKYVAVWKRHQGSWRITVDIFNSDVPAV